MAEAGLLAHTPFHTRDRLNANFELLGGKIPVLIIDGIYDHPHDVRRDALALDYRTPNYPYPGRIAEIPYKNASLIRFLDNILGLVNSTYLPRIPPIESVDSPGALTAFRSLHTDFAIVDRHPDELIDVQRAPHIDAVPIFGLIYLNEAERGGTLFFERADVASVEPGTYPSSNNQDWKFVDRIEGKFNRLAIYPGFVPHSGEIAGDWITTDQRFTAPRLTQRLVFIP